MRPDSPEDRLLSLIKGKYKKKDNIKESGRGVAKFFLTEFIRKIFLKNKVFSPTFLKSVNSMFFAILIALVGYLVYSLLFPVKKDVASSFEDRGIEPASSNITFQEKPLSAHIADYSDYSNQIKGKELFSPPHSLEKPSQTEPKVDVSKRFNLVGIIAGVEPQAIIEDRETQKTHYLYKDGSFDGVSVEEIADGKVVLSYKGEKITLVL